MDGAESRVKKHWQRLFPFKSEEKERIKREVIQHYEKHKGWFTIKALAEQVGTSIAKVKTILKNHLKEKKREYQRDETG